MKTSKRICKNGSLTLPKQIRAEAGLFPGNAVDIEVSPTGKIIIAPSAPCCRFCGSPEKLFTADGIQICKTCATKILAKVDVTND